MYNPTIRVVLIVIVLSACRCSSPGDIGPSHSVTLGATKAGGSQWDQANAVAVDQWGNVYVTGFFGFKAVFGNKVVTSAGSGDIFVAKYNRDLEVEWVTSAGGPGFDQALAIAVDEAGNTYVTGSYFRSATFGDQTITSHDQDVFVAKLNPDGNFDWVKKGGGEGAGLSIASDGQSVFVTGFFVGTIRFSGELMTSRGARDIFVVKYDAASGSGLWSTQGGGPFNDIGSTIGIGPRGVLYVGGSLFDHLIWDNKSIRANRLYQGFVAQLNSEGRMVWGQPVGGANYSTNVALAVDEGGDCVVAGNFTTEMTLGATTLHTTGNADLYVARFRPSGAVAWVQRAGGSLGASSITLDRAGNAFVTGPFIEEAFYESHSITAVAGDADVFVTKYNRAGALQWTTSAGIQSFYRVSVAADPLGAVTIAGSFDGSATLGSTEIESLNGEKDVFVWKVSGF